MTKLIFVHGSGGSGAIWRFQRPAFPEADFISLPGHPRGKPRPSVDGYTVWLHQYIQRKGYTGVVLAGHSLGGAIVMSYALKYPQGLKGLILLATGARLRVHPNFIQMLEEAIQGDTSRWVNWLQTQCYPLLDPPLRAELIQEHLRIGPAVQLNDFLCCDKFDIIDRLQEIKAPTLVLVGSADVLTPVRYADFLANRIAGAQEAILPEATHHLFLEKPQEFNRLIGQFLNTLPIDN